METLTASDAGQERISFGKTRATVGVVLATTLWLIFSVCLVPVLGIGVFLLPLTSGIAKQVQGAQLARDNHAPTAVTNTTSSRAEPSTVRTGSNCS